MTNDNKHANPLESIIDFALSNGADLFWANNAKDELKKLRKDADNLQGMLQHPVAWVRVNERGDLYDPRMQLNPYIDEKTIIPVYANREQLKTMLDKLKR